MSGPKIDYAEIERRKREELERARQERLRKIKLATDELHKELAHTQAIINGIRSDHSNVVEQYVNCNQLELTISRIQEIKKEYIKELNKLLNISIAVEPDDIVAQCDDLRRMNSETEKEYNTQIAPELKRIEEFALENEKSKMYSVFSKGLTEKAEYFRIEDIVFPSSYSENEEERRVVEECKQVVIEIKALINSEYISASDRKELMSFIEILLDDSENTAVELRKLITEYNLARSSIIRRMKDFEEYYLEYIAEYVAYIGILNCNEEEPIAIRPKSSGQFENVDELIAEISAIKQLAQYEEEQTYIREQIDEVMQQYGYSMCESIVLDTAQKGRHYISKSTSDDTAIHIHISESKQLMMEIVGTDVQVCDEISDVTAVACGCEQLSDYQKSTILEAQGKFCSMHPVLSQELRKRGVILTEKVHRRPDVKYCKKIINYVMDDDRNGNSRESHTTIKKKKKIELTVK